MSKLETKVVKSETPNKRAELLIRVEALNTKIDEFITIYNTKYEEMYKRFTLALQEQRDEIVRLREELRKERRKNRERRANAITRFKSE